MRPVSEREFINYVRGTGGYVTYSDAAKVAGIVLKALKTLLKLKGREQEAAALLPPGLRALWEEALPFPDLTDKGRLPPLLEAVSKELGSSEAGRKAALAVFGALKEKLQEHAAPWQALLDAQSLSLWEESKTVDASQEAGECL